MKPAYFCRWVVLLVSGFSALATGGESEARKTSLLCVKGIECGGCFYTVQTALTQAKGVEDAEVIQSFEDYARVVYDPKVTTEHQLADAVYDSIQLHADPYTATLKLRIPDYAEHAGTVDRLFAEWKQWVKLEVEDRAQGMLRIHFLPIEGANAEGQAQGWSLELLAAAMKTAGRGGVPLKFELPDPGKSPL